MSGPVITIRHELHINDATMRALSELVGAALKSFTAYPVPRQQPPSAAKAERGGDADPASPAPVDLPEAPRPIRDGASAVSAGAAGAAKGHEIRGESPVPPVSKSPVLTEIAADAELPRWTLARKALLTELYPAGATFEEMLARLNALPGPAITRMQIANKASMSLGSFGMGLRRPSRDPAALIIPPSAAPIPPPIAAPVPGRSTPAVPPHLATRDGAYSPARALDVATMADADKSPVSWDVAEEWARRNAPAALEGSGGMRRLGKINSARRHLGLPGFSIVTVRGPAEPLPSATLGG